MKQINTSKRTYLGLMAVLTIGLFLSACSSGSDSGGATVGTGSSSVEGNVTSVSLAMMQPASNTDYSLVALLKSLLPLQSAIADSPVEGVNVAIGDLGTMTNSSGYYRIDGVPAGTHAVQFSKNGQMASTNISVGENQLVSMQNIQMSGSQVHVQNTMYSAMGSGTPGTPGSGM